jgi:hypothetical protein
MCFEIYYNKCTIIQFGLHTSISIDKIMNIKSLHYAKGRQFQNIGIARCEIDTCSALLCTERKCTLLFTKQLFHISKHLLFKVIGTLS